MLYQDAEEHNDYVAYKDSYSTVDRSADNEIDPEDCIKYPVLVADVG